MSEFEKPDFSGRREALEIGFLLVTVSFRPEGEIFRVAQISPRSTRQNENDLNRYNNIS
jgi:hypothetical protein